MRTPDLIPYDIDIARRCAEILGPSSASSMALCELKRRLALGEDVAMFQAGNNILVGPRTIPAPNAPAERFDDGARGGIEESDNG